MSWASNLVVGSQPSPLRGIRCAICIRWTIGGFALCLLIVSMCFILDHSTDFRDENNSNCMRCSYTLRNWFLESLQAL